MTKNRRPGIRGKPANSFAKSTVEHTVAFAAEASNPSTSPTSQKRE
jgi:hypothetical protein